MSRRIATFLFALFAALILSACAMPYPFQGTGSVVVLPKEAVSGPQINNRQDLAEYQATLPVISLVAAAPKTAKASGLQINNRQDLAEYQATLPVISLVAAAPKTVKASGLQINNRQDLAEYQATLP